MEKTRFSEIITSLSIEDWENLNNFVISPVFNTNKQVIRLYEMLFSEKEENPPAEITKEVIWKYVYEGKEFNEDKFFKLTSDFVKLVEKYFIFKKQNSDELRKKNLLLETFREMNLEKNFSKYYNELKKYYLKEFNRNADYYLSQYSFKCEEILYNNRAKDFNIAEAFTELEKIAESAFSLLKLDISIHSLLSTGNIHEMGIPASAQKDINDIRDESPLMYGKLLIFKILTGSLKDEENLSKKYFQELKQFVIENSGRLNEAQLSYFYDKLLLCCERFCEESFRAEELQIHKEMDKMNLLAVEGTYLGYNHFLKVINCALSLGELEWGEKFLKKYGAKISPEFSEDTINLAKADIYIYLKKFDDALTALSLVDNHNYYFYLAKNLKTIIIYYEQEQKDAAAYTIDAVKHYLTRNRKTIGTLYDYYNNFLNLTNRLVRPSTRSNIQSIKNDLNEIKDVANKSWLERKIEYV